MFRTLQALLTITALGRFPIPSSPALLVWTFIPGGVKYRVSSGKHQAQIIFCHYFVFTMGWLNFCSLFHDLLCWVTWRESQKNFCFGFSWELDIAQGDVRGGKQKLAHSCCDIQFTAHTAALPHIPIRMSPMSQITHVFPTVLCRNDLYKLS